MTTTTSTSPDDEVARLDMVPTTQDVTSLDGVARDERSGSGRPNVGPIHSGIE